MFCGLKGQVVKPRFRNALSNPATTSDLPTFDPAPWIINARPIGLIAR
jgi:hypothetical protein